MYLIPVPAFAGNDFWVLHEGKRALAVDPGDAAPVLRTFAQHRLRLESILVTHHNDTPTPLSAAFRQWKNQFK